MPLTREQIMAAIDSPDKARRVKAALDQVDPRQLTGDDRAAWAQWRQVLTSEWVGNGSQGQQVVFDVPRSRSNAAAKVMEREIMPPPTSHGDPNTGNQFPSAFEQAGATAKGLGNMAKGMVWPPPAVAIPAAMAQDFVKAKNAPLLSGARVKHSLGVATGGMVSSMIDQVGDLAGPVKKSLSGEAPNRKEMLAANEASGPLAVTAALTSPKVQRGIGKTVKNYTIEPSPERQAKAATLYDQEIPRLINTRISEFVDDLGARIERGDNPSRDIYEGYRKGLDLFDPEVAKAQKGLKNEQITSRLSAEDMGFQVPEELVINAAMEDVMRKMVPEIGDNPSAHPHLKQIMDRYRETGQVHPQDYAALRDMATGKYVLEIAEDGTPVTGSVPMPMALRRTIGFLERTRNQYGGTLGIRPLDINAVKMDRYNQVPKKTFAKDPTDYQKTMADIYRGQAHGLRSLLDEVTKQEGGVSPISELNRQYANLAVAEDVGRQLMLQPDLEPPLGGTVMANGAGGLVTGTALGSVGAAAFGLDPGLGAVFGGTVGIPFGAYGSRYMRNLIRSPRTGVRLGLAKEMIGRVRGLTPPPRTTPPGPSGPPTAPQFTPLPPPTTPTAPPKSGGPAPKPGPAPSKAPAPAQQTSGLREVAADIMKAGKEGNVKQISALWKKHGKKLEQTGLLTPQKINWLKQKMGDPSATPAKVAPPPTNGKYEQVKQDFQTRNDLIAAEAGRAVEAGNANAVLKEVAAQRAANAPTQVAPPPKKKTAFSELVVERSDDITMDPELKGNWRIPHKDARPAAKERPVTSVAELTADQRALKIAEYEEGVKNATKLNDKARVNWYKNKIAELKGETPSKISPTATPKSEKKFQTDKILEQFDDFDSVPEEAIAPPPDTKPASKVDLVKKKKTLQRQMDGARQASERNKLRDEITAVQRQIESDETVKQVTAGQADKPLRETLRPAKTPASDVRKEPKAEYTSAGGLQSYAEYEGIKRGGTVTIDGQERQVLRIIRYKNGTVYVTTAEGQVPLDRITGKK